jgi:hypothetical protein
VLVVLRLPKTRPSFLELVPIVPSHDTAPTLTMLVITEQEAAVEGETAGGSFLEAESNLAGRRGAPGGAVRTLLEQNRRAHDGARGAIGGIEARYGDASRGERPATS